MIRLALIGQGKWGSKYLEAVKNIPDVEIAYTITHNYTNLHAYKDIAGIIIATPDATHTRIIKEFPNEYLLVEKPFTMSYSEAQEIKNENIMVGHIYLYNQALQQELDNQGEINFFRFKISNTEPVKNTTPLWYLMPHPVSIAVDRFGVPDRIFCTLIDSTYRLTLEYKRTTCVFEVRWDAHIKEREIMIWGDRLVYFEDKPQEISPLENQLRTFVDFIQGKPTRSGLKHAIEVTRILDIAHRQLEQ